MIELLHRELTGMIIGAYYEVYNHTSRMLPEYVYERALIEELCYRGYSAKQQDEYQIFYKARLVGVQRLDLFVVGEIVIENKVAERLLPLHKAQGLSYLKTVAKNVGLIFNFGSQKPEFDRLLFAPTTYDTVEHGSKTISPSNDTFDHDLVYNVVGGLYEVHSYLGPGFVHRIYANACFHELKLRGISARPLKRMQVVYKRTTIGDIAFGHLLIEGNLMVFPIALSNLNMAYADNLRAWMYANGIKLGIMANFNTVSLEIRFLRM